MRVCGTVRSPIIRLNRQGVLLSHSFRRGSINLPKPFLARTLRMTTRDMSGEMSKPSQERLPRGAQSTEMSTKEALPKLSAAEFREYNRLAETMDLFHSRFRQSWNILYQACEANRRPAKMSIRQFLRLGTEFCDHLSFHHSIEEEHIFPVLSKKMPAFRKELELLSQHKQIHKGLSSMQKYLNLCETGEHELRLESLKEIMDSFGEVLWRHLDEEVKELGAENMRRYWTLDEVRRLPM